MLGLPLGRRSGMIVKMAAVSIPVASLLLTPNHIFIVTIHNGRIPGQMSGASLSSLSVYYTAIASCDQ